MSVRETETKTETEKGQIKARLVGHHVAWCRWIVRVRMRIFLEI